VIAGSLSASLAQPSRARRCLTPIAGLVVGAIGLGAWTGRVDLVLSPLLRGLVLLGVDRYQIWLGRTP
jgi:Membrane transport protein MerF